MTVTSLDWLLLAGLALLAIALVRVVLHHIETRRTLKELQRLNREVIREAAKKGGDA